MLVVLLFLQLIRDSVQLVLYCILKLLLSVSTD